MTSTGSNSSHIERAPRSHLTRRELSTYSVPVPVSAEIAAARIARAATDRRKRNLYFLESLSRDADEARAFAAFLLNRCRTTKLGSPTMHAVGREPEQVYEGEIFHTICQELDFYPLGDPSVLTKEIDRIDSRIGDEEADRLFGILVDRSAVEDRESKARTEGLKCQRERIAAKLAPEKWRAPARVFLDHCEAMMKRLPGEFHDLVCQRETNESWGDWSMPFISDFEATLSEEIEARAAEILAELPPTRATALVAKAIENAESHRHMVWFAGDERVGKTTGAEAFARAHPHRVRLVELVADSDDSQFYQAFARGVGCLVEAKDTTGVLKAKIVQALRSCDQVLVLDEAHTIFGTGKRAMARRADWLRTALLNIGVPMVLIFTGLKFTERIRELRKVAEWNSKQFEGRRGAFFYAPKPDQQELEQIAAHYLNGSCGDGAVTAAHAAIASEHRIPTVMRIANEAAEIAQRAGRHEITADDVDEATGITFGFDQLMREVEDGAMRPRKTPAPAPEADAAPDESLSRLTGNVSPLQPPLNRLAKALQCGRKPAPETAGV